MTNDLTTIEGNLQEAIDRLEGNLLEKGVSASYDSTKGYFDLLDKILDIEPSIGGIMLNTALSIIPSRSAIGQGMQFSLSGLLSCSYDDTSVIDDDMEGYIKHGNIKIYDGNTLLDTVVTGNDGTYVYTFSFNVIGVHTLKVVYEGTDFYDNCENSINITVNDNIPDSITLTSDTPILSYAHSEIATLTATVLKEDGEGASDQAVTFYNGNTPIGTIDTNSNGVATITYTGQGLSDVIITAEVMGETLLQDSVTIEEYVLYDSGEVDKSSHWEFGARGGSSTLNYNANGKYYENYNARTTDSSGGNNLFVATIPNRGDMEILFDYNTNYSGSPYNFVLKVVANVNEWNDRVEVGTWSGSKIARLVNDSGTNYSYNPSYRLSANKWYTFKIRMENGQTLIQILDGNSVALNYTANDVLRGNNLTLDAFSMYDSATNYYRNIKVKAL